MNHSAGSTQLTTTIIAVILTFFIVILTPSQIVMIITPLMRSIFAFYYSYIFLLYSSIFDVENKCLEPEL